MKKWLIRCLTVLAMVCLIPGIVLKAAAETTTVRCKYCGSVETREVRGYGNYDSVCHRVYVTKCQNCQTDAGVIYLRAHTGSTETPTCTTGKTCEKCHAKYDILGHDWGAWTPNYDGTHTHTADASAATQKRLEVAAAATRPATLWECAILAEGVTTAVTHGASGHPPATAHTSAAA